MTGRQHTSADRQRAHRQGQRNLRYLCSCGRIIVGNPGWASHLRANPDHVYEGRA